MQTEFAAKQDAKLAASLEKARLKEEPKTTQRSPKPSKVDTPASASAAKQQKSVPVTAILKAVSSEEAKGKQKNQR
ncbi:MAG: hypothetical protein CFE44_14885 [Burkholderiales bacterium PBB4]|nr:MAG: hypothetical protein CFE44_14885 [Burkholderiales bacterium PBB4]